MDIFELLTEDHVKVKGLFEKIEDTTERALKTRTDLFEKINTELTMHAEIEETLFYPRLENEPKVKDDIKHSYKEHAEVKAMLKKLEKMDVQSDEFMDNIKKLRKDVLHHAESEEEKKLFPKCQKILSEEEAEDMADRATAMKKDAGM